MDQLDSDLLRTFLAVADAGSVTGGAARIHRSQSAASVQVKQLEALLGEPLFERHGRGVSLSATGELLLPVARQVVDLLDAALAELKTGGLAGSLRIGIPDDHSKTALAGILAEFTRQHPKVELRVHCALSSGFPELLSRGALDLVVHEVEALGAGMELLREEKLLWAASRAHNVQARHPVPVALFDRACWWRDLAQTALRTCGRAYRVVYASESVTGVTAAIESGIAIGVLGASALNDKMVALSDSEGLGSLPTSKLVLEYGKGADAEVCGAMAQAVKRAFSADPRRRTLG